jgi:hypothetical protein
MKAIILTTTHTAAEFEGIASVLRCLPDYTDILKEISLSGS